MFMIFLGQETWFPDVSFPVDSALSHFLSMDKSMKSLGSNVNQRDFLT